MKKRKYTRRTGPAAIKLISRIRGRNNRCWMKLLELAVKTKPRQARKILAQITANDKEVTKWLARV